MAGSYNHVVDEQGRLVSNEEFAWMIENLGDAYEMAEDMYGMIWYLAEGDPALVEEARLNWSQGIRMAPGDQRPQF